MGKVETVFTLPHNHSKKVTPALCCPGGKKVSMLVPLLIPAWRCTSMNKKYLITSTFFSLPTCNGSNVKTVPHLRINSSGKKNYLRWKCWYKSKNILTLREAYIDSN